MYKVKVDEKLLCFTGSVNGMEYVTDPDVKLVVNGVDSFSFAIYPQHPLYREIECKVSRVKIWRDSKLLFYGEVTGYSQDMYGIRTYDCEGALAWLNDLHFAYAISGATPKEVLYWYIKQYNQKLRDKSKSFELGTVTVHKALTQSGTEGTIARSSGVYPSFWEEIQDKLLDSFGGILRVRYVGSDTCAGYIDWLAIPDGTCSQDVRYAKNLLNCDWTYDCTALATAVVPLGKRKDSSGDNEVRLTIDKADDDDATFMIQYMTGTDDLVKSGNMVYSKSRMEKYGLIQQAVTFDDITDAGTLAYQGAVWLRQNGKAASTIRAEAIDLADIDESVEHFTHGDYVRTKLPGDSAESLFPITAIEIPIAAPENAKLTVGTQESGITSGSGGQGGGSIADAGSGADALAHTHSNKGVLDKITEQDYADLKGAVNKAHTHDNKETLDKIDNVSWLTVYGQTHEHSNKAVLDKLTAQDYSDFKGTVNKAHVHDNKSTLDKIDETSWLLVYGQTHEHENQSVLDKTTASYTADEKAKLAGIASGANKYVHPATSGNKHIPSGGSSGQILRWSADGTAVWGADNNTTYNDATQSTHGLMTAADKTKLDGIATGANKTTVDSALSATSTNPVQNKVVQAALNGKAASGHTHEMITNSMLNIVGANNAAKWVCLGTLVSGGDARSALIRVWSGNGFNAGAYQNASFEIQIKDGYQSTPSADRACGVTVYRINCSTAKVKVIPTKHNTYTVWVYLPWAYWNGNYAVYGRYTSWTYNGSNQTAEPEGTAADTAYYDQAFLTSTVANATTWNGLINDVDTYNSSDTWILVKKDNRIQHRYAGELDVNSAKTLTDSGWIDTTRNTSFTATSTVKCRKYGQLVEVRGEVTFSDTCGSPTVCTLPAGYRPATVVQACGITPNGKQYMIKADTSGVISFGSDSRSTFVKGTTYRVDLTYLLG